MYTALLRRYGGSQCSTEPLNIKEFISLVTMKSFTFPCSTAVNGFSEALCAENIWRYSEYMFFIIKIEAYQPGISNTLRYSLSGDSCAMNTLCDSAERANQKGAITAITAWTAEPEVILSSRGWFKKLCEGAPERLVTADTFVNMLKMFLILTDMV